MNFFKGIITAGLLSAIFSCSGTVGRYSRIDFVIPPQVNIRPEELKKIWAEEDKTDPSSGIFIVVTVYSYSSGSETVSFSGSGEMQTVRGKGRLKCLVKVMDGKDIIRAEFVEGSGNTKEEMFSSVIREIKSSLFK